METVTISKAKYEALQNELKTLRNAKLYKELLKAQKSIAKDGEFTRKDLGF
jgi:PHD/YefM family antitoxin component YafN of YafNO toxin-antitoxin module